MRGVKALPCCRWFVFETAGILHLRHRVLFSFQHAPWVWVLSPGLQNASLELSSAECPRQQSKCRSSEDFKTQNILAEASFEGLCPIGRTLL